MAKCIIDIIGKIPLQECFNRVICSMEKVGALIVEGRPSCWDDEGNQFYLDRVKLERKIKLKQSGNIQFWFNESEDIFVSWSVEEPNSKFSIFLDGMTDEQASKILNSVFEKFIWKDRACPQFELTLSIRLE